MYVVAQTIGAILGVAIAHLRFAQPVIVVPTHARNGAGQLLGEFMATFGLLGVIWGCGKACSAAVPYAVGAYIAAAYWFASFTSFTSFANLAVTMARALTNTFAGIRPADVPGFVLVQLAGMLAALVFFR